MAVTITAVGSDLKIDEGTETNYYPIDDMRQRAIGTTIEFYDNGKLVKSFKEGDFVSPSGTADQIADAVSQISTIGGGSIVWGARVQVVVTDAGDEVVPANPARKGLIVTNQAGNNDCWVGIGVDPVVDMVLPNEASLEINLSNLTTQAINAITKSGKTTTLTYQEAI